MNISISSAAIDYLKSKISAAGGIGFRVSVKKTGCSGYAYVPSIVHHIDASDHCIEKDDVKIYIDHAWLDYLQHLNIDYHEENQMGLKQKKLILMNPKETGRCGCGESFHI